MTNPESYITAAAALASAVRAQRFRSVVMASLTRGEGTSTAALEIASAVQQTFGIRTVLVEWNRLRPVYHSWLNLDPALTLSALRDGRPATECVQTAGDGIHVLPFGKTSPSLSMNGFHSLLCRTLRELEQQYQLSVVDAPPLLDSGEALAAAVLIRRLLLVVQAGKTSYDDLNRVRQSLENDGVDVIGAILMQRKSALPRWLEAILPT